MSDRRSRPSSAFPLRSTRTSNYIPTNDTGKPSVHVPHRTGGYVDETLFGRKSRPKSALPQSQVQSSKNNKDNFSKNSMSITGNSIPVSIKYSEYQAIKERSKLNSRSTNIDDNNEAISDSNYHSYNNYNDQILYSHNSKTSNNDIQAERLSLISQKMKEAEERKQRIIEIESQRSRNRRPSTASIEKSNEDKIIVERANNAKLEDEDFVKKLNERINQVKAIHTRKHQIEELNKRRENEKKIDEQYNMEMEIKDLKEFERLHLLEKQKQEKLLRDAEIIEKQREEILKRKKLLQEEEARQDQALISRMMKEEQDYKIKEQEKKKEQHELLVSGLKYTQIQLQNKKKQKEQEAEYDKKLVEYQLAKDKEQNDLELKRKQIQKQKALEVDKLRQKQQKDIDHKAQLNELRAKRSMECAERLARQRDIDEARKKAEQKKELNDFLVFQMKQKERDNQDRISEIKQLYNTEVLLQQKQIEMEKAEENRRIENSKKYREAILQELQDKQKRRLQEENEKKKAIKIMHDENQDYIDAMNRIKQKKIQELKDLGVEEQYLIEIERMDPADIFKKIK